MKKHIWEIIVLLLVLMQGISYLKMKELGQQILTLSQAMDNSHFAYNYRMTEMRKEFEDEIKKQNSILEKTELLFGELDEENLTFSITYLIIPKAISDNTKLYLTINSEKKPMKQDGIVFSHTEAYGLFTTIANLML